MHNLNKLNKPDIIKWIALIIVLVLLFFTALALEIGRTKGVNYTIDILSQTIPQ
jgi:hypothetical protein|tara:strand:- start:391 stop:552 length:162 start_codon:yes stop_codon:yes gene_type:complete